MTMQSPPDRNRMWRSVAWYGGTTLVAVIVAVVAINSIEADNRCRSGGSSLALMRTTTPNPLDLLTKPIPTPGATTAPTTLPDGTVCR